jgi:hypothetical protein
MDSGANIFLFPPVFALSGTLTPSSHCLTSATSGPAIVPLSSAEVMFGLRDSIGVMRVFRQRAFIHSDIPFALLPLSLLGENGCYFDFYGTLGLQCGTMFLPFTLVDGLNLDLVTYVLDFEEFSSLQRAFLKASVPDGEIPTDFAIQVLLWKAAQEHDVKTILTGMNYLTESGHIPEWSYGHSDWKYINAINEAFGDRPLKSYPKMTLPDLFKFTYLRNIKRVSMLNYLDYDRVAAEKVLVENYDWEKYVGKHNESTYTKFYQEILLPSKFGIDKRILHLSDLIRANQMTKVQAKKILSKDFSSSVSKERILIKYILKRLKLSEREFQVIMNNEKRLYNDFPNNSRYVSAIRGIIQILRKFKMYPH